MNYQINTGLILQEFSPSCECALCNVQNIVEDQLVDQFLSEAVMVDNYRTMVNNFGFCKPHTLKLLARPNKLSLALQHITRIKTLKQKVEFTSIKKDAAYLVESVKTCVICNISKLNMDRYYQTVAQMFNAEPKFEELLLSTQGFCFEHYGLLLKHSKYAGAKTKKYLQVLKQLQLKSIETTLNNLQEFCDMHDYRNSHKQFDNSKDALGRSIKKLHGDR